MCSSDLVDLTKSKVDKSAKKMVAEPGEFMSMIDKLKKEMHAAADDLNFERAAELRDKIKQLQSLELALR